jgi:YHS domain-containing protein
MKTLAAAIMVLCATALLAGSAPGADNGTELKPQTRCPVTGNPIDKQYFADYNGKRVYFCCPACPATFKEDPDKYMKKLADGGVTLENAPVPQTTCPVTGNPINKQYFADYNGKRVYFCCPACPATFKQDPDKYMKVLANEGVTLENTPVPQTMCPVMNRKINKKYFADYEGKRVYFCCRACVSTFKHDPEKYIQKLEDEGVTIEEAPATSE